MKRLFLSILIIVYSIASALFIHAFAMHHMTMDANIMCSYTPCSHANTHDNMPATIPCIVYAKHVLVSIVHPLSTVSSIDTIPWRLGSEEDIWHHDSVYIKPSLSLSAHAPPVFLLTYLGPIKRTC